MSKEGTLNRRNQLLIALITAAVTILGIAASLGYFDEGNEPIDKNKIEQENWGADSRNVR